MAIARDPVLEELRRSASLTSSMSRRTDIGLVPGGSTTSLEGTEQVDIGKLYSSHSLLNIILSEIV